MNRRGHPNRPYFDNLSGSIGGRGRGTPQQHYQPSRDNYNQQRHHHQHQQQSNFWQDNFQSSGSDSYNSASSWNQQPRPNPSWSSFSQGQNYWQQNQKFQSFRPPAPPGNFRTNRGFGNTYPSSREQQPPPPLLPTPELLVERSALEVEKPAPAPVNPPPGSKEAREKRLEESRDRLVKSLKESKNESSSKEVTVEATASTASGIEGKSRSEEANPCDDRAKTKQVSSLGKQSASGSSQQRRSSLESRSPGTSESSKSVKPNLSSKRSRSTSCSSNTTKKSDMHSKVQDDTEIQDIKEQVIQKLLTLSQNKLQEIVSNPRSRKFEFVMKYMMKESRCEESQKLRQIAQAGICATTTAENNPDSDPLDYEKLLSDPDLAVNLSNLPPEMIETLGNIFNLKSETPDVIDLDSSSEMLAEEINPEDLLGTSLIQDSFNSSCSKSADSTKMNVSESVVSVIQDASNNSLCESEDNTKENASESCMSLLQELSTSYSESADSTKVNVSESGSNSTYESVIASKAELLSFDVTDTAASLNSSFQSNSNETVKENFMSSVSTSEYELSLSTKMDSAESMPDSMEQDQFSMSIEESSKLLDIPLDVELPFKVKVDDIKPASDTSDILPLVPTEDISASQLLEENPIAQSEVSQLPAGRVMLPTVSEEIATSEPLEERPRDRPEVCRLTEGQDTLPSVAEETATFRPTEEPLVDHPVACEVTEEDQVTVPSVSDSVTNNLLTVIEDNVSSERLVVDSKQDTVQQTTTVDDTAAHPEEKREIQNDFSEDKELEVNVAPSVDVHLTSKEADQIPSVDINVDRIDSQPLVVDPVDIDKDSTNSDSVNDRDPLSIEDCSVVDSFGSSAIPVTGAVPVVIEPVPKTKPMVVIEQSSLDEVNVTVNSIFVKELEELPQQDDDSVRAASVSSTDNSVYEKEPVRIVKFELVESDELPLQTRSGVRNSRPAIEVSTQTDIPARSIAFETNNVASLLDQIGSLCAENEMQPAFHQLKLYLGAINLDSIPSTSTLSKQSIPRPKITPISSKTTMPVLAAASVSKHTAAASTDDVKIPVPSSIVADTSFETIMSEMDNVNPKKRLKLIVKKIKEIEVQIDKWAELKKQLYEQMESILQDERSASSSQEDSEDVSMRRASRKVVTPRIGPLSRVKPTLVSASNEKVDSPRPAARKRSRRPAPCGQRRKKPSRSASRNKPTPSTTSRSTKPVHNVSPQVVSPSTRTLRRTSLNQSPASSLRPAKVEAIVESTPAVSPLRKTKAELKQMVMDPLETEPSQPRVTRASKTPSEPATPEDLPLGGRRSARQLEPITLEESPSGTKSTRLQEPATPEELPSGGRRSTRQTAVIEPVVAEALPLSRKRSRESTGEVTPGREVRKRTRGGGDFVDPDCQVLYQTVMPLRNCSVVIEPLKHGSKKPRLYVKTDLFETRQSKRTCPEPLTKVNDGDSSSDDDIPLNRLNQSSRSVVGVEPPAPAIDIWRVKQEADQVSVSSCDTSAEPRTEDGDSTPASAYYCSRVKRKKSKKSKSRSEEGEHSEHHSSKHEQLIFPDHPRGAILEIKVVNRMVLAASEEGIVFSYSIKSGKLKKTYTGHSAAVTCFCTIDDDDEDQQRLITGSLDEYSLSFKLKSTEQSHTPLKVGAAVSIDHKWGSVFIGTKLGEVARIDAKTFKMVGPHMKFSDQAILALKATKEGPRRVLIVGTRNQAITVRDAETGLLLRSMFGQHTVYCLFLHKSLVYCGTMIGTIPVFDFTDGSEKSIYRAGNGVRCIKVYYGLLFAGCYDGFIYVFNVHNQRLITKIPGSGKMILCMDIAKNKIIFSCNDSFQALNFPADVCQALKDAKIK